MTGPLGVPAIGLALLGALLLLATAWVAGRLALRLLPEGEPRQAGMALAVGLALCGQLAFALGLAGWLRPLPLLLAATGAHLAGAREWGAAVRRARERAARVGRRPVRLALAALALATVAGCVLLALYPPSGFDETLYHLPMAREFANAGSLSFLADLRYPVFPALGEAAGACLWLLGGETATHAVPLAAILGCALLLLGRDRGAAGGGLVAAALFAGSPVVVYMAGSGYVEPLLALWATGALVALERWRGGGAAAWCALAGLCAGTAAATKYLGLLVPLYGAALVLFDRRPGRRGHGLLFLAVAAAAALPTYARLWLLTGNPLFPFLPEVFGASPWQADEYLGPRGLARLRKALTAPWDLVFRRPRLGWMPPFTPALPLLVPLLAWGAVRVPASRRWLAFPLLQLAAAPLAAHYLVMALPALAVAAGESAAALAARRARGRALLVAASALLLPGPLYAAWWAVRFGPPPTSVAARERYLASRVPAYRALRALEGRAPPGYVAYSVGAEHLTYFARGRWLGDGNGPVRHGRVLPSPPDPRRLAAALERVGARYLVVAEPARAAVLPDEAAARPWFVPLHAGGGGRVYERIGEGR